jgi:transcriptional regulator with XRE-family HTH domain
MTVAEILTKTLREQRISPVEAAQKSQVGRSTMHRLVTGDAKPQIATVRKLADGLGIDFDVLLDAALADERDPEAEEQAA